MTKVLFLPEVETDILAGYAWYEEKSPGLGEEFLRIFLACAHDIARYPIGYPKIHSEFRRRLLRRFPYAIYYFLEGTKL
jgi:hypothetical protein